MSADTEILPEGPALLKAMIAARKRKARTSTPKPAPAPKARQAKAGNVVSITDALRKSLETERKGKR